MNCTILDEAACGFSFPCCMWDATGCSSWNKVWAARSETTCIPGERWVLDPYLALMFILLFSIAMGVLITLFFELPEKRAFAALVNFDHREESMLEAASRSLEAAAGEAGRAVSEAASRSLEAAAGEAGRRVSAARPSRRSRTSSTSRRNSSNHPRSPRVTVDPKADVAQSDVSSLAGEEPTNVVYSSLLGVDLSLLEADRADGVSTSDVMTELQNGSRYLVPITDEVVATTPGRMWRRVLRPNVKLAIMSYRVQLSKSDEFTLAPEAFESALEAASAHGVTHIWLDKWAYRKQPPWAAYRHADFVKTLTTVMSQVDLVIWLPRSRADAPGQYQQRLWCSYEASMVAQRNIPVVIAGFHMNALQRGMAAWGSHLLASPWASLTSWYKDDPELYRLGQTNLVYLVAVLASISMWVMWWTYYEPFVLTNVFNWLFSICVMTVYFMGLARKQDTVARARHGQQVLRIMYAAASSKRADERMTERRIRALRVLRQSLAHNLPWLPGYDRRDALTVVELINFFDSNRSNKSLDALAVSTLVNARLRPSPGDDPAGKSVRSWLAGADIHLYAQGQIRHVMEEAYEEPPAAPPSGWLDRLQNDGSSRRSSDRDPDPESTESKPMPLPSSIADADTLFFHELENHSWAVLRGLGGTYIQTPAGAFWLNQPMERHAGSEWFRLDWDLSTPVSDWHRPWVMGGFLSALNSSLWAVAVGIRASFPNQENWMVLAVHYTYLNGLVVGGMYVFGCLLPICRHHLRSLMHHRKLSMPCIHAAGRLELAALLGLVLALDWIAYAPSLVGTKNPSTTLPGHLAGLNVTVAFRLLAVTLTCGIELIAAVVHAGVASVTHRHPRFLFEFTAWRWERKMLKVW